MAFPPETLQNVLGAWLADHGLRQLRIAETEKYAHVTFFFNGGEEQPFKGEDRILIDSPKVATYDLKPEMHAPELTDKLVAAINSRQYDVIICNFANPDMVGHTGKFDAAVKAIEAIDQCLARIVAAIKSSDSELLITADHGNAEQMVDPLSDQPHTAHTSNLVPFVYVGRDASMRDGGILPDNTQAAGTAPAEGNDRAFADRPVQREHCLTVTITTSRTATVSGRSGWLRSWPPLLLLALVMWMQGASADESADDKARRLEKLRSDIDHLRTTLSNDYGEKSRLENDLRSAELNIAKHSRALKKLAGQLEQKRGRLRELQQDKLTQRRQLDEQQRALTQQIRASYAMGRQGYLKILLSNEDPSQIGRTLTYYQYFNQARARRINDIGVGIARLEDLETTIGSETRQLEQLLDEQQQSQQQREQEYRHRRQILVKLNSEIGTKEQRLNQLIQDKERLVSLLEQLRKALSDIPPDIGDLQPFGQLLGKLSLPTRGHISHQFGSRRSTGKQRWQGITIDASEGNEVRAIYHGRVAFADWLRNFGMLIIIDHGDGYMSLYAHNQALYRDVGEWVDQGDVIATIGNSGGQDQSGLYFEIRHNGTPADPSRWIAAAKR